MKIADLDSDAPASVVAGEVGCSGFAAESVPFAIHLGRSTDGSTVLEKILEAVSAGGDTDTTGSMVGQIVGARLGFSALPPKELAAIEGLSTIRETFERFADFILEE